MDSSPINAFTVDVEDYFQVSAFEDLFPRTRWDEVPLRVERGLDRVLELLEDAGVHGTFYILGWLARRRPDLVRKISEGGHELGCHSLEHRLVYSMDRGAFRADLREALDSIEQAAGVRVVHYRAPSFSITAKSLWALEILAEEGIRVDSSIYPVYHDRYGIAGAPRGPFRPLARFPDFVELPPSTVKAFSAVLPCAGGGYLRLYPLGLTRAAIRRIQHQDGRGAVVYVHPWEFDPRQPVVPSSRIKTFRHRVGLSRNYARVRSLLETFRFGTMSHFIQSLGGSQALPLVELGPGEASSDRDGFERNRVRSDRA